MSATATDQTAALRSTSDILGQRMPRVDALTGLRWWAAFVVFAHHMGWATLPPVITTFLHYGYLGVTFFFVLSGFVLLWSAAPAVRISTFYWRRFARIYPTHLVALIIAIPVFYTLAPVPEGSWLRPVDVWAIALSLILIQAWFRDPVIFFSGNPPAWSLSYEAFFYATFPFISRVLTHTRRRGALIAAAGIAVAILVYRLLVHSFPDSPLPAVPWPVQHLAEFALGMALAWAMRCGWRPRIPVMLALAGLAALVGAVALAPRFPAWLDPAGQVLTGYTNELVTVMCAIVIAAVASRSLRGGRSLLAWRPIVLLGEWSFAFYLVHATFIYIAIGIVGTLPSSWTNLLWYVPLLAVSVGVSAALHVLVERPLEHRMRRWKDRRDERSALAETRPAPLP